MNLLYQFLHFDCSCILTWGAVQKLLLNETHRGKTLRWSRYHGLQSTALMFWTYGLQGTSSKRKKGLLVVSLQPHGVCNTLINVYSIIRDFFFRKNWMKIIVKNALQALTTILF